MFVIPYLVKNVLKFASVCAVSMRTHYDRLRIHIRVVFSFRLLKKRQTAMNPKISYFPERFRKIDTKKKQNFTQLDILLYDHP